MGGGWGREMCGFVIGSCGVDMYEGGVGRRMLRGVRAASLCGRYGRMDMLGGARE